MTTEKELAPNTNSDSINYGKFNKRQKSNISKIILTISFILLLISLFFYFLVRINSRPHPYRTVKQQSQLNSISVALELFNSDFNHFPPSEALDPNGLPYCGAMKLAEALIGQDLKGFHLDSIFKSDGKDSNGKLLYGTNSPTNYTPSRKGPYLPIEIADVYCLSEIFKNTEPFDGNNFVLCDTFHRVTNLQTGKNIGMPILYYKADTSKKSHDVNDPNNPDNIYNYKDNHALLALGVPGQPDKKHPLLEDPTIFDKMTKDYKVTNKNIFTRADYYILLSAGEDSLYGTKDDIVNFPMEWKPK